MADLTKKRWLILGLCCLINLCIGSVYAWSVFATPLAELISGGFFNDKFGPKKVIFLGGLIEGVATAAYGLSSVILPPIANALVQGIGVSRTFVVIGIVFLLVICVSSLFLFPCPDGFVPEGWTPPAQMASSTVRDRSWKEMLSSAVFYVMLTCMLSGAPRVILHDQLRAYGQQQNIRRIHLSLSYEEDTAMAFAVAEVS